LLKFIEPDLSQCLRGTAVWENELLLLETGLGRSQTFDKYRPYGS